MRHLIVFALVVLVACHPKKPDRSDAGDAAVVTPEQAIAVALADAGTIGQAAAITAPLVTQGDKPLIADGAPELVTWAATHIKWQDVAVSKDETSYLMYLKDPMGARGKRLCRTGTVRDIAAFAAADVGSDGGTGKVFLGAFDAVEGNQRSLYVFFALRSTGQVVRGSTARFCGFIAGSSGYPDPDGSGDTKKAVDLIGMFDLPENRK